MSDSLRPHELFQSMEFSRPEYWSAIPSPGDLPNRRIEPRSLALQADSSPEPPREALRRLGRLLK